MAESGVRRVGFEPTNLYRIGASVPKLTPIGKKAQLILFCSKGGYFRTIDLLQQGNNTAMLKNLLIASFQET
jgi:hypothetical protein